MKPAQWTAVLILASMVGGITFVMVLRGGSRKVPEETSAPLASLTFGTKRYPQEGDRALTSEINKEGHQDFWFINDSEREQTIGLNAKSCKCAQVELTLAPESWKPSLLAPTAARILQRAPRQWTDLPAALLAAQHEAVLPQMPEKEATTTPLNLEDKVVVPPGAIGWVRLRWIADKAEKRYLNADLWMNLKGGSINAKLEVGAVIADPMEVQAEVAAGSFDVRDLEKGKKVWLYCWSVTRPSFHIKAERVLPPNKPETDSFEVGQPIQMTEADLLRLGSIPELHMMRILSGYRIPVTLHAKAKNGTPFEMGHFRRYVKLSSDDAGIEPVEVKIRGVVRGAVTVKGNAAESGAINLGPFKRSQEKKVAVSVQTDEKGLDLELDSSRIPAFLKVDFPKKPEVTDSGHRSWLLRITVPQNAARGEFPRSDDPVYHDSAIYVKTKETPPRSIRIPVIGTANDD
jgi:hypothetical protein